MNTDLASGRSKGTDGLRGLTAVHPGHLQVHENHVEGEGRRGNEHLHRLLSVSGPSGDGPILLQQFGEGYHG